MKPPPIRSQHTPIHSERPFNRPGPARTNAAGQECGIRHAVGTSRIGKENWSPNTPVRQMSRPTSGFMDKSVCISQKDTSPLTSKASARLFEIVSTVPNFHQAQPLNTGIAQRNTLDPRNSFTARADYRNIKTGELCEVNVQSHPGGGVHGKGSYVKITMKGDQGSSWQFRSGRNGAFTHDQTVDHKAILQTRPDQLDRRLARRTVKLTPTKLTHASSDPARLAESLFHYILRRPEAAMHALTNKPAGQDWQTFVEMSTDIGFQEQRRKKSRGSDGVIGLDLLKDFEAVAIKGDTEPPALQKTLSKLIKCLFTPSYQRTSLTVIPAKTGIPFRDGGARQHGLSAFAGMTEMVVPRRSDSKDDGFCLDTHVYSGRLQARCLEALQFHHCLLQRALVQLRRLNADREDKRILVNTSHDRPTGTQAHVGVAYGFFRDFERVPLPRDEQGDHALFIVSRFDGQP
jgi:hypothetical protein